MNSIQYLGPPSSLRMTSERHNAYCQLIVEVSLAVLPLSLLSNRALELTMLLRGDLRNWTTYVSIYGLPSPKVDPARPALHPLPIAQVCLYGGF